MALMQLSDVIDVTVFRDLPSVNSPEKTAFFESGVIVRTPLLDELAKDAGKLAELPFWNDLGSDEPNYSDDSENNATPAKLVQGEQIARKAFVNKGWKTADLASELASGDDAMDRIKDRTEDYFKRAWQKRVIASCNGILADNVANDAGDMVHDVAAESIATQTVSTKWSRGNFTSATFTMGDAQGEILAIGVHSKIYKDMLDADDIDFIPDSEGKAEIPTYMNRRVIVDDSLPVIAGATDGLKYVSVLFGEGMFGYGEGEPTTPVEVERKASEGNGGGTEALWIRKTWLLHPFGYKCTGTPAGQTLTLAELAVATTWDRVIDRKNVPLAFLITN